MSKITNLARKPVNKRQASADIIAFAESLQRDSSRAPDKPTQRFYELMARDIKIALEVHLKTTK